MTVKSSDLRDSFDIFAAYGDDAVILSRYGRIVVQLSRELQIDDGDLLELKKLGWLIADIEGILELYIEVFDD